MCPDKGPLNLLPFMMLLMIVTFLAQFADGQQPQLAEGLEQPRQPIKSTLGGLYSNNITLFFRNSPFRVEQELVVESGCTMTIETGVQMFFETGVGMKVFGTLRAIGNEFAHIQMLPFQEQLHYDTEMPSFRLIDGPTVRQGRLQVLFRDRWRSVCTQVTNWTSVDTGVACRSMGYSDGGFWRFYQRNNDTYPFVMAEPKCTANAKNLWECEGLSDPDRIPLSENLCQGEDDLGLYCWGPPSFQGWAKHWKGIQIFHSPFGYVPADPDGVAVRRESHSRLEFLDILFAGYDGLSKNTTAALYVEGVPPLMNGLRVERSARDGIHFFEPDGPILIANSTVAFNRGHGIVVENAMDGRFFVNQTRIEANFGDGIWYKQKHAGLSPAEQFLGIGIGQSNRGGNGLRQKRQTAFVQREKPRAEMCQGEHMLPRHAFFPHLVHAHLANGSAVPDPLVQPHFCWLSLSLPARLPYAYTIQFLDIINRHPPSSDARTCFVVCTGNASFPALCQSEQYRVPLHNGVLPQSISLNSNGQPIFLGIQHIPQSGSAIVAADVDVHFRVHASVSYKAFYGLNVTNSAVVNNTGNGIQAINIRDRLGLHNVSVDGNQGLAGLMVRDGAADIWLNDTSLSWNWGDGANISFAGGSVNVNTSRIVGNRWRGFAFHHNATIPFWPLHQEVIFKGRPGNNIFYPRMLVAGNAWGGILVGNFCSPANEWGTPIEPKVLVSWTEFSDNLYHPHMEIFACQRFGNPKMHVDISGNTVVGGTGMGFRMEPCVNAELVLNSNRFHGISNTALLIRNAKHPQLAELPAKVVIAKNDIKMNTAQYIVSIGLNEDAPQQSLLFNQQNEVRSNTVVNPFPFLKPRSTPYAALVVSSSNVLIRHNCFGNPRADFEIGTELMEHAKRIDARENNWGDPQAHNFMHRIFDQFNRYSLANIEINPYAAVCNQRAPVLTLLQQFFRRFRQPSQPFVIGGAIYENSDLPAGKYTVTDDLHVTPGARLTLAPGTTLEFMNGIGMLVQGELLRNDLHNPLQPIIFTSRPLGQPPRIEQIRLVDEFGDENVLAGRLEVRLAEDGQWGTVCNRSWTAQHAQLACNQLGLTLDPENFENWRIFPATGEFPIVMDNIRCEEREFDLTKCRHDGPQHNVRASCRPTEVVGLRCAPPYWAGVRFSLLANPPTVTGQGSMHNWVVEKAGLFDFRTSTFSPALQIDWNYHTFHGLTIKDNFFDGIDIVYNDLTRKPAIHNSYIARNRRNGIVIRSMGLSAEKLLIEQNENAGVRYLPRMASALQRDIVSWLDRQEQPELEANGIFLLTPNGRRRLQVFESQLEQRKFLVAKATPECPLVLSEACIVEMELEAIGHEYGLPPNLVIQLVNRPGNDSDEDALLEDRQTNRKLSVRHNSLQFPLLASGPRLKLTYRRTFGRPSLILLVLFLDHQEYLDRFLHIYDSTIRQNQYGVSALHHSNLSLVDDSALVNRYAEEKIWFQRVNFTHNTDAVIWVHSPEYGVPEGTPLAEISWHVDNCSVTDNTGPILDTHRDLFSSANIFHWNFWSNTFANNTGASISVHLPDCWDLRAEKKHSFWMTENRFERNHNFAVHLAGFYAFANISSNNFTDNHAPQDQGILQLLGMEKRLVLERNRFLSNWGHWMVRMETQSQALESGEVPAFIQNNYIQFNHFLRPSDEYAEMWPRSYAIGIFGLQKVDVHFNRIRNVLMDFELVAGCKPQLAASDWDVLNVTHNWWGVANEAELGQRVFDVDDWNSLSRAQFSPFYTSDEQFINFWWWNPGIARLSFAANATDPPAHDLRGRLWGDKKLELDPERWYPFPYHYRPFRPYRITRDLTIMPGATLTIEKNVEVHVWPNVRILVYGNLIADGTLWQPIRFKPINATEASEQRGQQGTRYRLRRTPLSALHKGLLEMTRRHRRRLRHLAPEWRHLEFSRWRQRRNTLSAARPGHDDVFRQFPELRRENPQLQRFFVFLMENGSLSQAKGFLHFYNATSGEIVPSCDRHFTLRNAQVVCREMGFSAQNAYHWLTPQWDYNPKIRLLKTYMEPRECRGIERRLEQCMLRLTGLLSDWQCMDNEHFNYIHCGTGTSLSGQYVGHWGGITFARHTLEANEANQQTERDDWAQGDRSVLRHVEIVGGGRVHNDSLFGAALQVIQRSPLLENVNVTNSSLHAIQVVQPSGNMVLNRLNVSDNKGIGITLLTANLQSTATSSQNSIPRGPLNIPYQAPGLLDMCSSGKEVPVHGRLLLFYKYDSFAVDCVKIFHSTNSRNLGFRFVQVNLFPGTLGIPRPDQLSIYAGTSFSPLSILRKYNAASDFARDGTLASQTAMLSLHLRATAADGHYGFLAEVATLPTAPLARKTVEEVAVRVSRLLNNDRGAINYQNVGELGPSVVVEQCAIDNNGYHLFGNISTSAQAVQLHLHNSMLFLFRANSVRHNRGGLMLSANSSNAVARLNAILKSNVFAFNSNSTTLALFGNGMQRAVLLNNLVSHNFALYADTILVNGVASNFSHNLINHNVGWHTLDTQQLDEKALGFDTTQIYLLDNFFEANLALGHGNPYKEKYGFHDGQEPDEFISRRPKRQVLTQSDVSFDWWTHVGKETARFRSTVLAGSAHQQYARNIFNNPLNDFELATSAQQPEVAQFTSSVAIDARHNYWGPPGTAGVAAAKIRAQQDNQALIRVDFEPVLESNTSLIEGDCPAGWMQVGHEEFKSCFLFVGSSSTYADAVQFCRQMNAFMPILRNADPRQKELARRVDQLGQQLITELERINSFGIAYDIPIWIASVTIPSNQCGWMSSRTASIGEQNCNNLLPFLCEQGTKPYHEPVLWRHDFVLMLAPIVLLITGIVLITACALRKANRRDEHFPHKKQLVRHSVRGSNNSMKGRQLVKSNDSLPLDAFGPPNDVDQFWIKEKPVLKRHIWNDTTATPTGTENSVNSSSEYYASSCRADSLLNTDHYSHIPLPEKKPLPINGPSTGTPSWQTATCSCCKSLMAANGQCPKCSFSAESTSYRGTRFSTTSSEATVSASSNSSDTCGSTKSDSTLTLRPTSITAKQPLLGQPSVRQQAVPSNTGTGQGYVNLSTQKNACHNDGFRPKDSLLSHSQGIKRAIEIIDPIETSM